MRKHLEFRNYNSRVAALAAARAEVDQAWARFEKADEPLSAFLKDAQRPPTEGLFAKEHAAIAASVRGDPEALKNAVRAFFAAHDAALQEVRAPRDAAWENLLQAWARYHKVSDST